MALALTRNKQIGIKLESTAGTKVSLTAADYGLYCSEISPSADPELIRLEAYRGTISADKQRVGKVPAKVSLKGELKGAGVTATAPRVSSVLLIAGMAEKVVKILNITSAVNWASLVPGGSVVVGGTSSARGVVLSATATVLNVAVLSGTFQAESISCSAVSFTATVSSIGAGWAGLAYVPISDPATMSTATVEVRDSGVLCPIYGAAATFSLEFSTDGPAMWSSEITGICDTANWGAATTELAGVTYESHTPAVVSSANLMLDGTTTPIVASVSVDLGNGVSLIKDLNSSTWFRRAVVTQRDASAALEILALSPAEYPAYTKLFAGTTASLSFGIGSGSGTGIKVFAPTAQFTGITGGDSEGYAAQSIKLGLSGSDDNEIVIWFM